MFHCAGIGECQHIIGKLIGTCRKTRQLDRVGAIETTDDFLVRQPGAVAGKHHYRIWIDRDRFKCGNGAADAGNRAGAGIRNIPAIVHDDGFVKLSIDPPAFRTVPCTRRLIPSIEPWLIFSTVPTTF